MNVLIFDKDADWLAERLSQLCPAYSYSTAATEAEAMDKAAEAEVLVALAPWISAPLVAAMPRLAWIHALTTGYDNLLRMAALSPGVAITNTRGIHGPQMAELAMLSMLALSRNYRGMLANQERRQWQRWPQPLLFGKSVCIVGLGAIAEALAERCRPFGMRVIGVSDGRTEVPGFERVFARADIAAAAAEADFVVVVVPYSAATRHIVGDAVLAAMRPSAFLVNIARGGCVDEAALLAHLDTGSIAGAALDVFATEPLPVENPIWAHPGIIVTPHIGGMSDVYREQVLPLAAENLERYAAGGAGNLVNRVARPTTEQET